MSQAISPGIIIPILTWTGIVLFVTPFILSCCIKYCRSHPQSKMTKCINFPIFLTKSCINATFKHKKYILDSDTIHVNTHTQQDIERGPNTTTTTTTTTTPTPTPTPTTIPTPSTTITTTTTSTTITTEPVTETNITIQVTPPEDSETSKEETILEDEATVCSESKV